MKVGRLRGKKIKNKKKIKLNSKKHVSTARRRVLSVGSQLLVGLETMAITSVTNRRYMYLQWLITMIGMRDLLCADDPMSNRDLVTFIVRIACNFSDIINHSRTWR